MQCQDADFISNGVLNFGLPEIGELLEAVN